MDSIDPLSTEIFEITQPNNTPHAPAKTSEENPTSLSQRTILGSKLRFCLFLIFLTLTTIVAVLVVCLTTSRKPILPCTLTYRPLTSNAIESDSRPQSAVLGDFNHDQILDIAIVNSGTRAIGILLGLGAGRFSKQTTYFAGIDSHPHSIAVDDFNSDTHLDIVVANDATHRIDLLLGNGHGSFTLNTQYSTGSARPIFIVAADLNADHHADAIYVNQGTDSIAIRFGQGDGTFSTPVVYFTGYDSSPCSMEIADVNKDQQKDMLVALRGTDSIGIFWGNGDGTFRDLTMYSTGVGSRPSSVVTGDFNNDDRLDIVVVSSGTNSINVLLGRDHDAFIEMIVFTSSGCTPQFIAVHDMNADRRLDIVVTDDSKDGICILLGNGNGSFSMGLTYSTGLGSKPSSLAIGDLNSDQRPDLVVTNNGTNNVGVMVGYDPANFTNKVTYSLDPYSAPVALAVGDLNEDNRLDIVVANTGTNTISILFGRDGGLFGEPMTYSTGSQSGAFAVALGDFNNDGHLDITVANPYSGQISVFLGIGSGKFNNQTTYSTGRNSRAYAIAVGDFNNDHRLDIVVPNAAASNIGVFMGDGTGRFSEQITYTTGDSSYPLAVAVTDLNDDNCTDIAVGNFNGGNVGLFFGYCNGTFANQVTLKAADGVGVRSIAIGDFNNDRKLDIVYADNSLQLVGIFLGYGNGTFASPMRYSFQPDYAPYQISVGDMNKDTYLDIAVVNNLRSSFGILLGDGTGQFSNETTFSTGNDSAPSASVVTDVNKDGRLDFIITNRFYDTVDVLFGYDSAAFLPQATYPTGSASHPTAIAVGDFDQDQRLDIVLANYGTESIAIRLGTRVGTFGDEKIYYTGDGSLPYSIGVTDCNQDKHLDIVLALLGNHSFAVFLGYGNGSFAPKKVYATGSNSFPSSIVAGDFNHDHWTDIVVANSGNDNIGLFLGYRYASFTGQIAFTARDYAYPKKLAAADFNNDNHMDIVATLYYDSTIVLLRGHANGTLTYYANYSTGAQSRPHYIAIGDLDRNGYLDIVVNNELGYTVEIFLGVGNGYFAEKISYSTGDFSEPRAVVVADLDHDTYLDIVVVNFRISNLCLLLGLGNGSFGDPTFFSLGEDTSPYDTAAGDFDQDSYLDLAIVDFATIGFSIVFGDGNGTFGERMFYSFGESSSQQLIAAEDVNEDGRQDIIIVRSDSRTLAIFLGYGNRTFESPILYTVSSGSMATSLAFGDLNNDNHVDMMVTVGNDDQMSIFLGFGDGTFGMVTHLYTGFQSGPSAVVAAHLNEDDLLDLVITNEYVGNVNVFLGYCCEPYVTQAVFPTGNGSRPRSVVVGDLNLDGNMDMVFVHEGSSSIGVLLGYGNGSFHEQIIVHVDTHPFTIALADFNQDRFLDVVMANAADATVNVLNGNGNGIFENGTTYTMDLGARPNSLVVDHFNDDTHLDIAVGNDGTNTVDILYGNGAGSFAKLVAFSTGYNTRPCSMAVGDFNNDTSADIVITNGGSNNVGIVSKTC